MALTDLSIRHARPLGKAYRLSDCHGLYIQVNPSGSKLWYPAAASVVVTGVNRTGVTASSATVLRIVAQTSPLAVQRLAQVAGSAMIFVATSA